jgi:hypothetical protein
LRRRRPARRLQPALEPEQPTFVRAKARVDVAKSRKQGAVCGLVVLPGLKVASCPTPARIPVRPSVKPDLVEKSTARLRLCIS